MYSLGRALVHTPIQANGSAGNDQNPGQIGDQMDEYEEDVMEGEENSNQIGSKSRRMTEFGVSRRRYCDKFDDIEDLVENAPNESGLDIFPSHCNDTHTIVREGCTFDKGSSRKLLCGNDVV
jgi:hypothetical protein